MYHFVPEQSPELRLSDNVLISSRTTQYLKSFQLDAVRFLHERLIKQEFSILNDESRLGKCASVVALLSGLGASKKTLIVLQNDDHLLAGWQFHLGVLTDLPVCVIKDVNDSTESAHSVYLSKWSVLRSIGDLSKLNFDYIIVDHRGFTLNNSFCTSMLLKQFERKVNIVISSVDITSDVKLVYNILRLGGCLDYQYKNFRCFERKFHLPDVKEVLSKRVDLEEYYKQRGVLGEYIKVFRLRRYRHQFDSNLPLVTAEQYRNNLSLWLAETNSHSTLSGSTIASTSDARSTGGTDEIYESLMNIRRAREMTDRDEPEKISLSEHSDEVVAMEPLVFEMSESEAELVRIPGKSIDVVVLSSDECEIVTPPTTPTAALSPRTKRKSKKRFLAISSTDDTDSEVDQPSTSRNTGRRVNVKLSRVSLPSEQLQDKPTPKATRSVGKPISDKHEKEINKLKKTTTEAAKKAPKSTTPEKVNQQPTKHKESKQLEVTPQPTTSKTPSKLQEVTPQATTSKTPSKLQEVSPQATTSKTPSMQPKKTELERKEHQKTLPEPRTPISKKPYTVTPKTEPRAKRRNSICLSPRQTRGMQRLTRSADIRINKYMLPKLENFNGRCTQTRKRIGNVNQTPKSSRQPAKQATELKKNELTKESATHKPTDVKPNVKKGVGRPKKHTTVVEPIAKTSKKQLPEKRVPAQSTEVEPKSTRSSRQTSQAKKQTKTKAAAPEPTQELISSGSVLSDYSFMQCAQKLPECLSDLNSLELPEFRRPYAPPATPLLLPSTLNLFSESEVAFISNSNKSADVVSINSSHDESSEQSVPQAQSRRTRALKRKRESPIRNAVPSASNFGLLLAQQRPAANKSPDIFSHCSDLSQLALGQAVRATSPFQGFKIFGSEVKQLQQQHAVTQQGPLVKRKRDRSCLDILEKMFDPQSSNNKDKSAKVLPNLPSPKKTQTPTQQRFTLMDEDFFEITNNGEFGSRLRLNSSGNVSPVQQQTQQQMPQRNKITNYLITSGGTPEDAGQRTQASQALRKSPKGIKSTQSTKLTRWFGTATGSTGESQSAPSTPVVPSEKVKRAREARSAVVVKCKRLDLNK